MSAKLPVFPNLPYQQPFSFFHMYVYDHMNFYLRSNSPMLEPANSYMKLSRLLISTLSPIFCLV